MSLPTRRLQAVIDEKLYEAYDQWCKDNGTTVSKYTAAWVKLFMDRFAAKVTREYKEGA